MKKNVRNALAISGMTLAIGASGLILDASANMGRSQRVQRSHQERILKTKHVGSHERMNRSKRSFTGKVSEVSENSITFSNGDKTYTARISDRTRFLDNSWNKITISNIKIGDKIKVIGKSTENTVLAKTVHIISNGNSIANN